MIGRPDLIDNARYVERLQDPDFGPEIDALFLPWVLERTKAEVMQEAQSHGVPVGALHTMEDIFDESPTARARVLHAARPPGGGAPRIPRTAVQAVEARRPSMRRAPLLGEHTSEVLSNRLGYSRQEVVILRQRGVV